MQIMSLQGSSVSSKKEKMKKGKKGRNVTLANVEEKKKNLHRGNFSSRAVEGILYCWKMQTSSTESRASEYQ